MAKRLVAITLMARDPVGTSAFYKAVFGLRSLPNAPLDLVSGLGLCPLRIRQGEEEGGAAVGDGPTPAPGSGALSFPFPVIAVSNLSAVRRQAVRLGGTVTVVNVGQPSLAAILTRGGASGGSGTPLGAQPPPAAAILTDPGGVSSLVLHLFKRNPVMAMALGSSSPHTLGGLLADALGLPASSLGLPGSPAAPPRLPGDLGADLVVAPVVVAAGSGSGSDSSGSAASSSGSATSSTPPSGWGTGPALGPHTGRFVSHVGVPAADLGRARDVVLAALPPDDVLVDQATGSVLFFDSDGNAIELCASGEVS